MKKRTGSFELVRFYHASFISSALKLPLSMKKEATLRNTFYAKQAS